MGHRASSDLTLVEKIARVEYGIDGHVCLVGTVLAEKIIEALERSPGLDVVDARQRLVALESALRGLLIALEWSLESA